MNKDNRELLSVQAKKWSDDLDEIRAKIGFRPSRYMYQATDGSWYVLTVRERRNRRNAEKNRRKREAEAIRIAEEAVLKEEIRFAKAEEAKSKAQVRSAELYRRSERLQEMNTKWKGETK